nr:hypothetical protein [Tanacetum cinerariifolium]
MTTDPSPRPTFDFTAKLFLNMKLNWDRLHMPLLAPMLVVPTTRDGADTAAAHDVTPVREPTPVRGPTPVRDPTPMRDPTPVREPTPSLVREPTPDSPGPPSPPPRTEESNEALQTLMAMAVGGAEDSATLTALSLKFDRCLNRVTTLENELGITKKVLGGAVLKLVTRVKRLEGLLQQKKWKLVLSDSEGEDATPTEQDIDLAALYTLVSTSLGGNSSALAAGPDADTTMPFRSTSTTRRYLKKPFTSSAFAHVTKNILAGASVPDAATTVPAGSSVDAAVHVVVTAPSSSIPTAADKGKAPMVDDSLLADLLSEQERVLKNLHDSQLKEELAKKIHVEQEVKFARQQEELAQKAHAERVAFPTTHGTRMSDQRPRELLAKIATNSALSKQLLRDDVTEENMNEWLGMLLLRKRRELADQSRVKPMTKTQQMDNMRDFVKNNSASVFLLLHRFLLMSQFMLSALADISVPAVSPAHVVAFVPAETVVHTAKSHVDDPLTASEHVSTKPTVAAPTPSSLRIRRKHIAKKRVTPIMDMDDVAMIKFDSDSDSDDDPLPYAPYASWEMVPSPLGQLAHSQLAIISSCISLCVGDGGWMGFLCWFSTTPQMVFSSPWLAAKKESTHHEGTALSWLVQEQTALGKDKSNRLTVGSLLKTTWSSIHHLLTDEVLTSLEQMATDQMLLFHDPAVFGVLAALFCWSPYSCWFLVAVAIGCCWYVVPAGRVCSHSCYCFSAGKYSACYQW